MGLQITILPSHYPANGARGASCKTQSQSQHFSDESWAFTKSNASVVFLSAAILQFCDFLSFFQRAGLKDVSTKAKTNVIPATHLWGMFLMMKVSAWNSVFQDVLGSATVPTGGTARLASPRTQRLWRPRGTATSPPRNVPK